ncbi:hypothetical protein [Arthrobacter sp. ISL-69]|uniref:hypothetical protein n=1 Tax=Arthrobacter sp. ISL-69 TaxID=2819113 RepID=UPI001BE6782F|nr:hypothetical protein [Arthrobacter sp. ISL-69]MBT2537256.1 hypothetical protein [Arthrobacter sp. ISL-69]
MNDHDAMEAVSAVLEQYYRAQLNSTEALHQIAYIIGQNAIDHAEAKKAQP